MTACSCCGERLIVNETHLCSPCFLRWLEVQPLVAPSHAEIERSMATFVCDAWAREHLKEQHHD